MVNIGVIGVGAMGYNHVRVLLTLKDASLVAIADANKETLNRVSKIFSVSNKYLSYKDMIKKNNLDVVIIAVPSNLHKEITIDCLNQGLNVFVEKPIAHSIEEGNEMILAAEKQKKLLMVGHIERFNPVVSQIKEFIKKNMLGHIYLVNTVRVGPYPKRLRNVGVLIDLAVHDVDILRHLVGEINEVYSQLIMAGDEAIYCKSLFKINSDINGSSEFSWVSPKRTRTIQVYGVKGIFEGNYQDQTLKFYENPDAKSGSISNDYHKELLLAGSISSGKIIEYPIVKEEPLKIELEHLIDCVKHNKKPMISGHDALKALKVALHMLESGKNGESVLIKY